MGVSVATIADVARESGVSRTSVSFAFNDPSRLATATLERVLEVAQRLGYYPNPVARSLSSKRVGALGLLIPQRTASLFANPHFSELLRGIGHICDRHSVSLLLVPPVQGSLTQALGNAAVDGFMVIGLDAQHPAILALGHRQVPFVTVDGPALEGVSAVNVDDRGGARAAAGRLLALGHRELLIVGIRPAQGERSDGASQPYTGVGAERLAGYRAAFAEAAVPFPEDYVITADSSREGGQRALRTAWLAGARPTALLAMSDIIALGALEAARDLGLRVPQDLAIIGFDDILPARWTQPGLTTVHQPTLEKGMRAARLLVDHQSGGALREHVVLPASLVVRGSCGGPDAAPTLPHSSHHPPPELLPPPAAP